MSKIYVEMTDKEYEEYKKFLNDEIDDEDLYVLILKIARRKDFLKLQSQETILDPLAKPTSVYTADFGISSKPNDAYQGKIRCIIREERMLKYK